MRLVYALITWLAGSQWRLNQLFLVDLVYIDMWLSFAMTWIYGGFLAELRGLLILLRWIDKLINLLLHLNAPFPWTSLVTRHGAILLLVDRPVIVDGCTCQVLDLWKLDLLLARSDTLTDQFLNRGTFNSSISLIWRDKMILPKLLMNFERLLNCILLSWLGSLRIFDSDGYCWWSFSSQLRLIQIRVSNFLFGLCGGLFQRTRLM